jgi:hypothetical protein
VIFVLEIKVNLIFVSYLGDKGYLVMFEDGRVLICSEGATLDAAVRIGIKIGMMYRMLVQSTVGSNGILDLRSMFDTIIWYDIPLMEDHSRTSYQGVVKVAAGSSSSEGVVIATTDLMVSN